MSVLKIARMGHPVLASPARPVEQVPHPGLNRLVQDMIETMHDADGTGLAAPQVHVPLRVVVFFVEGERDDARDGVPLTVLVNPEIEVLDDTLVTGPEACLSVPGLMGEVPRYRAIRYTALDPQGGRIEREARDFHARVVQHECDHLDGTLYVQRMRDMKTLAFVEEVRRAHRMRAAREEMAT